MVSAFEPAIRHANPRHSTEAAVQSNEVTLMRFGLRSVCGPNIGVSQCATPAGLGTFVDAQGCLPKAVRSTGISPLLEGYGAKIAPIVGLSLGLSCVANLVDVDCCGQIFQGPLPPRKELRPLQPGSG
jgi:hypothetical protein